MKSNKQLSKAFTLAEILVVISILGVLAASILVILNQARVRARDSRRIADLSQISKALELYYDQYGFYPPLAVHVTWTGNWCDNTPSCLAQADQNWDSMITALRTAGIITDNVRPIPWWGKLANLVVPNVYAASSNKVQDLNYPNSRYEYMPAALPLNQNYRLRAKLENPNSVNSTVKGKFFWSEDYKATGPDSCDISLGYYCAGPNTEYQAFDPGKPVVYLYPTKTENVSVQVYPKSIEESIPAYNGGWNVIAHPNGDLLNLADNTTYPYLFWEGQSVDPVIDRTKGFVTPSANIENFLRDKLGQLGLTASESQDFIDYWAPKMKNKAYTYVYFMPQADYDKMVPMTITPKPDTEIRVYMFYKSLDQPISVQPQILSAPLRTGFTVVEWGGNRSELK